MVYVLWFEDYEVMWYKFIIYFFVFNIVFDFVGCYEDIAEMIFFFEENNKIVGINKINIS